MLSIQIWSCGWAIRNYKVKKSTLPNIRKARLKNQEWGGLETPIHYWSPRPSLQLMI